MSDDTIDLPVSAYDAGDLVTIEALEQRHGRLWAVRRLGCCLAKDGKWEVEPLYNRNEDFMARCRFATARAALDALRASKDVKP